MAAELWMGGRLRISGALGYLHFGMYIFTLCLSLLPPQVHAFRTSLLQGNCFEGRVCLFLPLLDTPFELN